MAQHHILGWVIGMAFGLIPLAFFVLARRKDSFILIGAAMYLLAITIAFAAPSEISIKNWFAVGQPSRYSLAPAVIIGVAGVLASRSLFSKGVRWAPLAAGALLLVGVALDGRGDPQNSRGPAWSTTVAAAQAECEKSRSASVQVEFTPLTDSHQWRTDLKCAWLKR